MAMNIAREQARLLAGPSQKGRLIGFIKTPHTKHANVILNFHIHKLVVEGRQGSTNDVTVEGRFSFNDVNCFVASTQPRLSSLIFASSTRTLLTFS